MIQYIFPEVSDFAGKMSYYYPNVARYIEILDASCGISRLISELKLIEYSENSSGDDSPPHPTYICRKRCVIVENII